MSNGESIIRFDPMIQLNRPGLLLQDNILYITFGGHCDRKMFHGWIFAYDVSDPTSPKRVAVYCTTPNETGSDDGQGGIWMSGQGRPSMIPEVSTSRSATAVITGLLISATVSSRSSSWAMSSRCKTGTRRRTSRY